MAACSGLRLQHPEGGGGGRSASSPPAISEVYDKPRHGVRIGLFCTLVRAKPWTCNYGVVPKYLTHTLYLSVARAPSLGNAASMLTLWTKKLPRGHKFKGCAWFVCSLSLSPPPSRPNNCGSRTTAGVEPTCLNSSTDVVTYLRRKRICRSVHPVCTKT